MPTLPFVLLAALLVATGCSRPEVAPPASRLAAVKVHVAVVQAAELPVITEVTGTVRPVRRAALAARVMGTLIELPVSLGQAVREGDVLARLSTGETAARVAQSRAQLNLIRRDLERERTLVAQGASTAETARTLEDRLTAGEAQLQEAEVWLGYAEIRAPFDGVIARRLVNSGDLASPGQPLLEIEGTTDLEVEAAIPDSAAAGLTRGTRYSCEAGGTTFTGTLTEISSTADAATRTIGVKLAVPAGTAVRSGQFTRVEVSGARRRTILVPGPALSPQGQMERVFVVGDGNRAVLRIVKSGALRDGQVEILTGLAEKERVVLAPPAGLGDGQALEVQP